MTTQGWFNGWGTPPLCWSCKQILTADLRWRRTERWAWRWLAPGQDSVWGWGGPAATHTNICSITCVQVDRITHTKYFHFSIRHEISQEQLNVAVKRSYTSTYCANNNLYHNGSIMLTAGHLRQNQLPQSDLRCLPEILFIKMWKIYFYQTFSNFWHFLSSNIENNVCS